MTNLYYEAEFPGVTAGDALADAKAALRELPFKEAESSISVGRFWGSNIAKAMADEEYVGEENWSWVATLKAQGTYLYQS